MAEASMLISDPLALEDLSHASSMADLNPSPSTGIFKVCVLSSSYEGSDSATKLYDDVLIDLHTFLKTEKDKVKFEVYQIRKSTAYREIRELATSGRFDVFFNLCDGSRDEDRAGEDVVRALEEFGVPFTGARSKYYEFPKPDMKMMAHYYGLRTARHAVIESFSDVERKCGKLRFPVIVKHVCGYGSVGMTKDSKCTDMASLLLRVRDFLAVFRQALVEEFIEGEEATVLACGDITAPDGVRVFEPVVISFPDGEDFKHFDIKWVTSDDMQWRPIQKTHRAYKGIMEMGRKAFKVMMGGVGYGRTDIRIDKASGEPYFLELNTNCGILYPPGLESSADFILKMDASTSHEDFIMTQIRMALEFHRIMYPSFVRDFDPVRGYHLRATKQISKGTVVFHDEGRPHRIVTKPYVLSTWDADDRKQFEGAAWPLGTDRHVYAVWDTNPAGWRPLSHSCDPNMSFDVNRSLNVIAVRNIERGEELSMDYATFYDETMQPFDCQCGATNCRKRVAIGSDSGEPGPEGIVRNPFLM